MNTFIYLSFILLSLLFVLKKDKNIFYIIPSLVLATIASSMFSRDAFNYSVEFSAWSTASFIEVAKLTLGIEPSYRWLSFILGRLELQFWSLTFAYSAISIPIIYISIKKYSVDMTSGYLVFFSYFFLLQSCTQIRAGVASALGLLGLIELASGNRKRAIIYYSAAFLFHYSAMIYSISLFFLRNEISIKKYIILLVFSIFLYFIGLDLPKTLIVILGDHNNNILTDKYMQYKALMESGEGANIRVFNPIILINLAASITLLIMTKAENALEIMSYKLIMISFIAYFLLIPIPSWAFRVQEFLFFPIVLVAGKMRYIIKYDMHNIFITLYCALLFSYIIFFQKLFSI